MTETTRETSDRPKKTLLICPVCSHESPVDGDWEIRTERDDGRDRQVYACPECGETITSRPVYAVQSA